MKTTLVFVVGMTASAMLVGAPAEPALTQAKPACCSAHPADQPTAAAPLSEKSIYQTEAQWTNDAGETVTLTTLRGRPVVLAMFFANCEYACPVLVNDMKRLRDTLPPEVRAKTQFVLVSFDADRDTPAALHAYRNRGALDSAWTLLRGDDSAVQELAMLLGVKFKRDARGQFAHSNLLTILNEAGEVTHQRSGLMGDVSDAAKAVALASNP